MKRRYYAPAIVLVGAVSFQKEAEDPNCENGLCANQPIVAKPKHDHDPQEKAYEETGDDIPLMNTSPLETAKRGSKRHREYIEWLKENGLEIKGAL